MVAHQAPPSLVFSRQEHCSALPFPGWKHQSSVFFGRTDAKAETPILWPCHAKSWFIGKDSDAGRDWGQEEKGTTGWDGWIASPTRYTCVWVNSGSWWWTGRPGMLWFMGSQSQTRLSDWTELTELRGSKFETYVNDAENLFHKKLENCTWSESMCLRENETDRIVTWTIYLFKPLIWSPSTSCWVLLRYSWIFPVHFPLVSKSFCWVKNVKRQILFHVCVVTVTIVIILLEWN